MKKTLIIIALVMVSLVTVNSFAATEEVPYKGITYYCFQESEFNGGNYVVANDILLKLYEIGYRWIEHKDENGETMILCRNQNDTFDIIIKGVVKLTSGELLLPAKLQIPAADDNAFLDVRNLPKFLGYYTK